MSHSQQQQEKKLEKHEYGTETELQLYVAISALLHSSLWPSTQCLHSKDKTVWSWLFCYGSCHYTNNYSYKGGVFLWLRPLCKHPGAVNIHIRHLLHRISLLLTSLVITFFMSVRTFPHCSFVWLMSWQFFFSFWSTELHFWTQKHDARFSLVRN